MIAIKDPALAKQLTSYGYTRFYLTHPAAFSAPHTLRVQCEVWKEDSLGSKFVGDGGENLNVDICVPNNGTPLRPYLEQALLQSPVFGYGYYLLDWHLERANHPGNYGYDEF